jgi:hypothetical protein
VKLITDNKWKHFTYGYDVPKKVLKDYDHLDSSESTDQFLNYHGVWYHLSDFLYIDHAESVPLRVWDGYYSESAFSAVVIRVSRDCESYQIGRFIWESSN